MLESVPGFPGVFSLSIPIASPLKYVNCYLANGPDGWTLIDTGFHDDVAEQAWTDAFADLGIRPEHVSQIVLTHTHVDHAGAAGWLQALTGAPVVILDAEMAMMRRRWLRGTGWCRQLVEILTRYGLPAGMGDEVYQWESAALDQMLPHPTTYREVRPGDMLSITGIAFRCIHTPGHIAGHMMLFAESSGLAFAGDHVLMKISPNIGHTDPGVQNPLADYLQSLSRVAPLPVSLGLPGHRQVITDWPGRIRELLGHHEQRLQLMGEAANGGATAWDVTQVVFPNITPAQQKFALAESAAHLEYLIQAGRLTRELSSGVYVYRDYAGSPPTGEMAGGLKRCT